MRKLIYVATFLMSTSLMVSCGSDSPSSGFTPRLSRSYKCDITIVGEYSNFEALEAEFDKFKVYYPKVNLDYEKVDDYVNNIVTVLNRENKPNIFFSYASWMSGEAKYEPMVAHMELLSDPKLDLDFSCLRQGLVNKDSQNNIYMAPIFSRTYGMLVNNDLFNKEGIAIPTTWNELLSACDSFKEKGYQSPMMGFSSKEKNSLMVTFAYPSFVAALANNPQAVMAANNLESSAGVYMEQGLTKLKNLVDSNKINLTECSSIKGDYDDVIFRFFKNDVPMMICTGDTASGTKKRENHEKSDYPLHKFEYSYRPIPLTDNGGYFIDSPSVEFSVNKECDNLDMTNEFMRFLLRTQELDSMATIKRLITPTKDKVFDQFYARFAEIPAERTYLPEAIGIKDPAFTQIRNAAYKVANNQISIEYAITHYGTL